jgi:hypothetical protein
MIGPNGQVFTTRVTAMGIRNRPISQGAPWQNGIAIGTLRRECLDHVVIFGKAHLRRVLSLYAVYYNQTRTHLGLAKDAPLRRAVQDPDPSSPRQFYSDCIIATPGYDFQEGQVWC